MSNTRSKKPAMLVLMSRSFDAKYLPAYLCLAEFSARNQEWERVFRPVERRPWPQFGEQWIRALLSGDGLLLSKQILLMHRRMLCKPHRSISIIITCLFTSCWLKSMPPRVTSVAAAAELRAALKNHNDPAQEDIAKRYLAKLEAPVNPPRSLRIQGFQAKVRFP